MGDMNRALRKSFIGVRKRPTNNRSGLRKAATQDLACDKRALTDYTLTPDEMAIIQHLSDAAKLHHGYDSLQFVVENSVELKDPILVEQARKVTAKIEDARGNVGVGKYAGNIHVETLALRDDAPMILGQDMDIHGTDPKPSLFSPSPIYSLHLGQENRNVIHKNAQYHKHKTVDHDVAKVRFVNDKGGKTGKVVYQDRFDT